MPKLFSNMPAMFEKYNPEDVFADLTYDYVTYDEDGRLHSHNGQPSDVVNINMNSTNGKVIAWHAHGVISREKESPHIILSSSKFLTHDNLGRLHSFNGMPSKIINENFTTVLEWHDHGKLHRSGELPATIFAEKDKILAYSYYENGCLHRSNNQPAYTREFNQLWYVRGWQHNTKNHSGFNKDHETSPSPSFQAWRLYNAELSKETFDKIKSFEAEQAVPLWVAFLHTLEVIHDTELLLFLNESGSWDNTFPIKWVLKSWGVTSEKLNAKVAALYRREGRGVNYESYLTALLEITKFEDEERLR